MKIGGLQKISLINYPGMICAVIFTQGCNFRCPYCHNPELVNPDLFSTCLLIEDVLLFLEKRRGKLDAVTITGGEPTIQNDLITFIQEIKTRDYLVKIDTNGSHPDMLRRLIEAKLIDYIAMDIKGPLDKYPEIIGRNFDFDQILKSIKLIMKTNTPYEFRTTVTKSLLKPSDVLRIGDMIENARAYYLQPVNAAKTLSDGFVSENDYTYDDLESVQMKLKEKIQKVYIR